MAYETPKGRVLAICISQIAGEPMQLVNEVEALAGHGLVGDRYCTGQGSFNKTKGIGARQVTLINGLFFPNSGFEYVHCRRNIITEGVELMWLIGREFQIGSARFRGLGYNEPCNRPSKLAGIEKKFQEAFFDRGGLMAEVLQGGAIFRGSSIVPPPKKYKV